MEHHIDMDLGELKQKLLTLASHAETAVNEALRALVERDYELALRVKESDNVIDQLEVEIDDMAIHLLAKAPLASDLRLVAYPRPTGGAEGASPDPPNPSLMGGR